MGRKDNELLHFSEAIVELCIHLLASVHFGMLLLQCGFGVLTNGITLLSFAKAH